MVKLHKIPDNVMRFMLGVEKYLNDHPKVIFAYLFGSLAKRVKKPTSDVDIAVYLKRGENYGALKLELLSALSDLLQTDEIDLVILNTASLPLAMNILKGKRRLVDKRPFERHGFESLTMRKYLDFSIKESALLRKRYLHGR